LRRPIESLMPEYPEFGARALAWAGLQNEWHLQHGRLYPHNDDEDLRAHNHRRRD
jgi:hypothetical protein